MWSEQGIINDGTSEVIKVVPKDRDRVEKWLKEHRGKSICKIEFKSDTYVESMDIEDDDEEEEEEDIEYVFSFYFTHIKAEKIKNLNTHRYKESKPTKKKRGSKSSDDERDWRTYYTVEDNETLKQISKDFGGSPSIQELIDANIEMYPNITGTSPLHLNTAIFIEPIDPNLESRIVDVDDVVFVRWPAWGDIWYECIVSEGEEFPWVVDSAPGAEPMFTGGPYVVFF